jgi:HEPN domain-containing protein
MSAPADTVRTVRPWVEKAEQDYHVAVQLLKSDDDEFNAAICFHAQQAAEKYIKAFLVQEGIEFPYTHDLRMLLSLVPTGDKLEIEATSVIHLNRYAIRTRYPGDLEPVERKEARAAVATARRVRKAVRGWLPKGLLSRRG